MSDVPSYTHTGIISVPPKSLVWLGSARSDLKDLPRQVQRTFGYALYLAQAGGKHPQAKPLRGFGSAGVLEIVEDWRGDAYRAVYTVRFSNTVFVLHVFQKKASRDRETPKPDLDLIKIRLRTAREAEEP